MGFTGGHYHRNWAIDGFRTLILNANLDDKGPKSPRIKPLSAAEIDALKASSIDTAREAKFPPLPPQ